MAVPGGDVLVSGLRVCQGCSTSMLGVAVLRVFNMSSDILVPCDWDGCVTTTWWFRGDVVLVHGITEISLTSS